jgi:hypothetical protein
MTVVGNELICDRCSRWISLHASCLRNRSRIRTHGATNGWGKQGAKDLCPKCDSEVQRDELSPHPRRGPLARPGRSGRTRLRVPGHPTDGSKLRNVHNARSQETAFPFPTQPSLSPAEEHTPDRHLVVGWKDGWRRLACEHAAEPGGNPNCALFDLPGTDL